MNNTNVSRVLRFVLMEAAYLLASRPAGASVRLQGEAP